MIRREIARGDARLALELLARRHPDRWGKNRTIAPEEEPVEADEPPLDLSRLSGAEYETLKELHRRASDR